MTRYGRIVKHMNTKSNSSYRVLYKYLTPEVTFHILCVSYVREYHPNVTIIHSPNEGKRGFTEQARIKLMGVESGCCDLLLIKKDAVLHPLFWAELKWNANTSDEQTRFIANQIAAGHHAEVYKKDFEAFAFAVREWLKRD